MQSADFIIVGGGAAGIFCAVNMARLHRDRRVLVLEKTSKLLSKVKISGGGRCNVTHACFDIDELSRRYPRGGSFVKKTFHQFGPADTVQWFADRGVALKTEEDGRMFPVSNSSQTIIDCLMQEVNRYGVTIEMNADIKDLAYSDGHFTLVSATGRSWQAPAICIACGGFPKLSQFDWLASLGHTIESPVPSLFTFNMPGHPITKLMGLSVEQARVRIAGSKLESTGPLLITHWGMSGPAILRLSAWAARELHDRQYNFSITVNWLPAHHEESLRTLFQQYRQQVPAQKISNRNQLGLPHRLWEYLVQESHISPERRWADLSSKEQNQLIRNCCHHTFDIKGKTTFKDEFVTAGGIRLNEIDHRTLMSRKHPGLYFAGEILDVDGITGGYNFQHAWTSGMIVAKNTI
ncbi:MAG: NAD(P)/FAD-dependent oxidoreductase [Chitinophagaceae bacterium]